MTARATATPAASARPNVGVPRRLALALALLVPVVIDPFGEDTQGAKALVLSLCGLAALVLGATEVFGGRRRPDRTTLAERLLIALLGWAALSLCWARNAELGLSRVLLLAAMVGLAIGVRELCTTARRAWLVLLASAVVGAVAMAADAVAVAHGSRVLSEIEIKHASALFVHNNMAASYVTMLVPLFVVGAFGTRRVAARVAWGAGLAGALLYLAMLGSRAGLLGAGFAVLVAGLLFLLRPRLPRLRLPGRRWALPAAVVLVLLALLPLSDGARGFAKDSFYRGVSLLGFDLPDVSFRPLLWRKTIEMVKEHPLRGVGAGNWVVEFPRFERQSAPKPHAHNDALQVLAELGLPGLLLFLALLASLAATLGVVLCSRRGPLAWQAAAAVFASVVVFAVCGQFEVPFALGATAGQLAVSLGVAGALLRLPDGDRPAAPAAGRAPRALAALTLLVGVPALGVTAFHLPGSWMLARAEERARAGDLDGAARLYERVSDLRTGAHVPERMLGQLALQRADGEDALRHIRAARELWPYTSELAEDEGDALTLLGRHDEAVERYAESLAASPGRASPFYKLVVALDAAGRLRDAIDKLQYRVCTDRTVTLDSVQRLADMWRRVAQQASGQDRIEALVAARHDYAVLLQEARPVRTDELNRIFKDLTHQLQVLPDSPASWWATYERFLKQNSLRMPYTALWTSMDDDAHRLFPGWVEPLGPPVPDLWRMPP